MQSSEIDGFGDVQDLARRLCPETLENVVPVEGGGNSRLFRVGSVDGTNTYALKIFPPMAGDAHNRLAREVAAMTFFSSQGEPHTPALVATDRAKCAALIEWIDGEPAGPIDGAAVTAALDFARRLRNYSELATALELPAAAESGIRASDLMYQVTRRHTRLRAASENNASLTTYLRDVFAPLFTDAVERARDGYAARSWEFRYQLPKSEQTLSPSDFGFHNARRRTTGEFVFFDFEYFGWDDPVRLVSDFVLHPGMAMEEGMRRRFLDGAFEIFGKNRNFEPRFNLLYPLVGLRWCMILLNEFLPERASRRAFARGMEELQEIQSIQLRKAEAMAERVKNILQGERYA